MKRSGMVEIVREYLNTVRCYDPDLYAEEIVDIIEEAGMKPPERELTKKECVGAYYSYQFHAIKPRVNVWEPENN